MSHCAPGYLFAAIDLFDLGLSGCIMAAERVRAAKAPAMSAQSQVCSLSSVLTAQSQRLLSAHWVLSVANCLPSSVKPQPYQVIFCSHDSLAFCFLKSLVCSVTSSPSSSTLVRWLGVLSCSDDDYLVSCLSKYPVTWNFLFSKEMSLKSDDWTCSKSSVRWLSWFLICSIFSAQFFSAQFFLLSFFCSVSAQWGFIPERGNLRSFVVFCTTENSLPLSMHVLWNQQCFVLMRRTNQIIMQPVCLQCQHIRSSENKSHPTICEAGLLYFFGYL